jgi:hypothetical protein
VHPAAFHQSENPQIAGSEHRMKRAAPIPGLVFLFGREAALTNSLRRLLDAPLSTSVARKRENTSDGYDVRTSPGES